MCPSATLGAAAQEPTTDLPVSLDRIREELARTPPTRFKLNTPPEIPVAIFRTQVKQRIYVLSLEDWLHKEFELNDIQRQSADWAAKCCGIAVAPLIKSMENALERRRVEKIRRRITRELDEIEATRKTAPAPQ